MFLSVQELEHRNLSFDVAYRPGEIQFAESGDDLTQSGLFEASGVAQLVGSVFSEIRVRGHVRVKIAAVCDRCLEKFEFPVDSDFDLFYRSASASSVPHEELQIDEGEAEIAFYEGEGIELEDVLREFILLNLPMQRVCQPECKGICPECGGNRNQVDCGCRPAHVDERWAALKKL